MSKQTRVAALMAHATQWPIPREAVRLIAMHEDCKLTAYRCPAGVWTIGWGETDGVQPGMRWTQAEADARFLASLQDFTRKVQAMCTGYTSPQHLGALVSLAYNIGPAALRRSTVLRLHNAGDEAGAARAFALWNKARVHGQLVPLAGLTARRAAEAALYLAPGEDDEQPAQPNVQSVEPESSLAASPIAQAGATTVAAGAATLLTQAGEHAQALAGVSASVRTAAEALGLQPGLLLALVLIAAGAAGMWWRYKQRAGGWA
jgi:lysozyme